MMQRPHVTHVDTHWRIKSLQRLQEVRSICKTRNQLNGNYAAEIYKAAGSRFLTTRDDEVACWFVTHPTVEALRCWGIIYAKWPMP
jgi:hypothetical protein